MATGSIDVRVENQLVRFVCPTPLDHDRVISEVGGQRNSGVVIQLPDDLWILRPIPLVAEVLAGGPAGSAAGGRGLEMARRGPVHQRWSPRGPVRRRGDFEVSDRC